MLNGLLAKVNKKECKFKNFIYSSFSTLKRRQISLKRKNVRIFDF